MKLVIAFNNTVTLRGTISYWIKISFYTTSVIYNCNFIRFAGIANFFQFMACFRNIVVPFHGFTIVYENTNNSN